MTLVIKIAELFYGIKKCFKKNVSKIISQVLKLGQVNAYLGKVSVNDLYLHIVFESVLCSYLNMIGLKTILSNFYNVFYMNCLSF